MYFVLDVNRPGAIKGALTRDAALLIQTTWGGSALIHEAKTLIELKAKAPEYFSFIKEQIALAPVPVFKPSGDPKRRERIHTRKQELFDHTDTAIKRRISYEFRARAEANERKRLQKEYDEREARKRARKAAAKALIVAQQTTSKGSNGTCTD